MDMTIIREHTTANVAPAILKLREQVNAAYPERDKASDGIWPSAAHTAANPTSDHEAGNALDIDDDLGGGETITLPWLEGIRLDPRTKYVIHEQRIGDAAGWRTYTGSNPHTGHAHVSVREDERTDASAWRFGMADTPYWVVMSVFETEADAAGFKTWCGGQSMACVVSGIATIVHGNDARSKAAEAEAERRGAVCPFGRISTTQTSYRSFSARTPLKPVAPAPDPHVAEIAALKTRVAALTADVALKQAAFDDLKARVRQAIEL